ncbi:hypothetical protein LTR94_036817, partial [Friedmanniomyces endolithicus]
APACRMVNRRRSRPGSPAFTACSACPSCRSPSTAGGCRRAANSSNVPAPSPTRWGRSCRSAWTARRPRRGSMRRSTRSI